MSSVSVEHRARRSHAIGPLPIILALLALLVGLWAASISMDISRVCEGFGNDEGMSYHTELAAWPPGAVTCEVVARNGTTRESTFMPWREYSAVALFALAVGIGSAAFSRRRTRRARWLSCACLLLVVSTVLLFRS